MIIFQYSNFKETNIYRTFLLQRKNRIKFQGRHCIHFCSLLFLSEPIQTPDIKVIWLLVGTITTGDNPGLINPGLTNPGQDGGMIHQYSHLTHLRRSPWSHHLSVCRKCWHLEHSCDTKVASAHKHLHSDINLIVRLKCKVKNYTDL